MHLSKTSALLLTTLFFALTQARTNYIVNGDFSSPFVSVQQQKIITPDKITGWYGSNIEIGLAKIYTSQLPPNLPVMKVMGANQTIRQIVKLPVAQIYTLTFTWAPQENQQAFSQGQVLWNGKLIMELNPQSNFVNIERIKILGRGGFNLLELVGKGAKDNIGALVALFSLQQSNQVINGDFIYPPIITLTTKSFPNGIIGWSGASVQVTLASSANSLLGEGQVLELSQPYTAIFNCGVASAKYILTIMWGLRTGTLLSGQSLKVLWNGVAVVGSPYTSLTTSMNRIDIQVAGVAGSNTLQLSSTNLTANFILVSQVLLIANV